MKSRISITIAVTTVMNLHDTSSGSTHLLSVSSGGDHHVVQRIPRRHRTVLRDRSQQWPSLCFLWHRRQVGVAEMTGIGTHQLSSSSAGTNYSLPPPPARSSAGTNHLTSSSAKTNVRRNQPPLFLLRRKWRPRREPRGWAKQTREMIDTRLRMGRQVREQSLRVGKRLWISK